MVERSGALHHGQGGPRFESRRRHKFFRGNREIREKSFFFTLMSTQIQYASDFEEHLGLGLGKNASITEIWIVAVYCEEEDLKWNI